MWLLVASLGLVAMPRDAAADLTGDRVDFAMYGRAGLAWTRSGQVINGRSMALTGNSLAGRFEEGDYLEPSIKFHIVKGKEERDTDVDAVLTLSMFPRNGSFLTSLSSNADRVLGLEVAQAYVEARDVFVPGLSVWGGARFYRGADVHIADLFYFNALNGQGFGAKYKGFDAAVLLQTSAGGQYSFDTDGNGEPDLQRQRTVFVAQYVHELGMRSTAVHGLGEVHLLPAAGKEDGPELATSDYAWVLGAKLHLDLDNGAFNDLSVRFGSRIANGAAYGASTFYSFGNPATDGTYDGGYGLQIVDHFLWNFGRTLTLNAFGIVEYSKGGSDAPEDKSLDVSVGARSFLYAHDQFHLINEVDFQALKRGEEDLGTVVKVSVVPTIVPNADRSAWARPHLRLIYTAGFYNQYAADNTMSPFLQTVGRTKTGHYLGTRAEWWF